MSWCQLNGNIYIYIYMYILYIYTYIYRAALYVVRCVWKRRKMKYTVCGVSDVKNL